MESNAGENAPLLSKPPPELFDNLKLIDLLAQDTKPAFIVNARTWRNTDIDPRPQDSQVVWFNEALACYFRTEMVALPDQNTINHNSSYFYRRTAPTYGTLQLDDRPLRHWILTCVDLCIRSDPSVRDNASSKTFSGVNYFICPKKILWTYVPVKKEDEVDYVLFTGIPLGLNSNGFQNYENETSDDGLSALRVESPRDTTIFGDRKGDSHISKKREINILRRESSGPVPDRRPYMPSSRHNSNTSRTSSRGPKLQDKSAGSIEAWANQVIERANTPPSPSAWSEATARPLDPSDMKTNPQDDTVPLASKCGAGKFDMFDWTRLSADADLPEHIRLIKNIDWANKSVGDMEFWPQSLRTAMCLMTSYPMPVAMYIGTDFVTVYNESYQEVAGAKHPSLLGLPFEIGWPEIWDDLKDVFNNCLTTGKARIKHDDKLFLHRNGFLEETYFTWSLIPIFGEDGAIIALLNPAYELTKRVLAERRMLTLGEAGDQTAQAFNVKTFWTRFMSAMEVNPFDTPFAMMYSRRGDLTDRSESSRSSGFDYTLDLECSLGVPDNHPLAPESLDLRISSVGLASIFREAQSRDFLHVEIGSSVLPYSLFDGVQWRGFEERCRSIVVCPIHAHSKDESVSGFFVLGVNNRRPFDDDYRLFLQLLTRQLTTSLGTILLFAGEVRRNEQNARVAAMEKVVLSEQLAWRTREARDYEHKFAHLAAVAPVGIFIGDGQGQITYINDTWYDITQHPRGVNPSDWLDSVHPEDVLYARQVFMDAMEHRRETNTVSCRWKVPYQSVYGEIERWTIASSRIDTDENGNVVSLFGCLTNISEEKYAESVLKKRVAEAAELKRQQDNFVDMASHEMRNPLSAILQCADTVITSLGEHKSMHATQSDNEKLQAAIEASVDAAQTILLCASHQKRVVDDILTMSKLDSTRLMITPVDVMPEALVQEAMKMFEQESLMHDIKLFMEVGASYRELNIEWVRLDPTRLLQIIINLVTNALKFIREEEQRTVIIKMGASRDRPVDHTGLVLFRATRDQDNEEMQDSDQSPKDDKDKLYLKFQVQDTGKGLTDSEVKMLFQRFNQATPKTHVQYGGSGLGLFICRELVHLQDGEIGVSSEAGKGSSFSFYIKCQRGSVPEGFVPTSVQKVDTVQRQAKSKKLEKTEIVTNGPETPHYKVLIVEDNLVNQRVVQRQLHRLGHETYVANHGLEALGIIEKSNMWTECKPDAFELSVILMDVEMPVMDGLTATKAIRKLQEEGKVKKIAPIIAVTANARPGQIKDMFEAGVNDVLSKPFRIPELIEKLNQVVGRA